MMTSTKFAALFALSATLLMTHTASAQDTPAPADAQRSPTPLRLQSSFWAPYGVDIVKGEQTLDTGMFFGGLVDAVEGEQALEHARSARRWSIAGTALSVTGAGLLVADFFVYNDRYNTLRGWPNIVPTQDESFPLFPLAMVASAGAVVSRYMAYEEMAISVSVHNSGVTLSGSF